MAWGWEYAPGIEEDIRNNLSLLPRRDLEDAFAQWIESSRRTGHQRNRNRMAGGLVDFNHKRFHRAMMHALGIPRDLLEENVFDRASEMALMDNGGFDAWISPDGWSKVSTSPMELDDDDRQVLTQDDNEYQQYADILRGFQFPKHDPDHNAVFGDMLEENGLMRHAGLHRDYAKFLKPQLFFKGPLNG